jgi:hypothetical protein
VSFVKLSMFNCGPWRCARCGHTWFVRVQIPAHLWKAVGGKREFVKTLKTGDLNEANRLKHAHVAAFSGRLKRWREANQVTCWMSCTRKLWIGAML